MQSICSRLWLSVLLLGSSTLAGPPDSSAPSSSLNLQSTKNGQAGPKSDLSAADKEVLRIRLLPPGPGNPRNSEGDFIGLKGGRILFVYTHFTTNGLADDGAAHLASRFSDDSGVTWSAEDQIVVPNEGQQNVMSVSLLRLADDRIGLFYARKNSITDCRPFFRTSSDEGQTWSAPQLCVPDSDIGYYVINNNRVVQLKSGRLLLPLALHQRPGEKEFDLAGRILFYLSDDNGSTWRRSQQELRALDREGKAIVTQEPGLVELNDGRLLLFCRTDVGYQYVSHSADNGDTWTPLIASNLRSPCSPASIRRIPSTGDLMVVWNDYSESQLKGDGPRTPLRVGVSSDEGQTWSHIKTLEGDPQGHFCYTAIHFVGANHVLLAYCASPQSEPLVQTQITRFSLDWLYR